MEIRKAVPADAGPLSELARETFCHTFSEANTLSDMELYVTNNFSVEKQLTEINDPQRWIEMAWVNQVHVGYYQILNGQTDPSVTGKKPLELVRLYVQTAWHGKGVAAALLSKALGTAAENGFLTVWLGVWEENHRARKFYRKNGFRAVGSHIFTLGTDEQTDLIMERSLSGDYIVPLP